MLEITISYANLHDTTATPSTSKGIVKNLPKSPILWDTIEQVHPITLYDILTEPSFRCIQQELTYIDKFFLSILHKIEKLYILWKTI